MTATYENIATTTLSTNQTSVTFSSIAGTHTDLILVAQGTATTSAQNINLTFNSDTSSLYSRTVLFGASSSANAQSLRDSNVANIPLFFYGTSQAVGLCHIMNYASTSMNKTVISRNNDRGGSDTVNGLVGLYRSNNAITSLTLTAASTNLGSGSIFTLYGIKAE